MPGPTAGAGELAEPADNPEPVQIEEAGAIVASPWLEP